MSSESSWSTVRKVPAGCTARKLRFVLNKSKGYLWMHGVDDGIVRDCNVVLYLISLGDWLEDLGVTDWLCDTFYNNGFSCVFRTHHAIGILGQVASFARETPRSEIESIIPPHTPNSRQMRPAIGTCRSDPKIARVLESQLRPSPG